jgi:hypothetical protein
LDSLRWGKRTLQLSGRFNDVTVQRFNGTEAIRVHSWLKDCLKAWPLLSLPAVAGIRCSGEAAETGTRAASPDATYQARALPAGTSVSSP